MKKPSKILLISLGLFLIAVAGSVVAQDEIPPFVSVIAEPSEATSTWQNTQASTYVSCIDEVGGSGCDNESYRLKIYDTDPETCPDIYQDYTFCNGLSCTLSNSQTIFSHQWVCAAATDLALNIGFSEPVEFKIDTTFPIGTISASPVEIRADEIFNIKVTGEDNIDMGTVCYKEEDDIDWTCHTCAGSSTSCSHTFPRSESDLGKYIYYGYVADFVENGSFTDPTYVLVIVETDPSVSTISAINIEDTQATLEGDLTYMGGAEVVEVWFEYGLTPDYGSETEHILRNNTGTFDIAVTDLFPGTEYHFRAVAKNGVGIAYGDDLEFTTFIELINNGGFESGDLTGWEEAGWGGEREVSTEDVHNGSYSGLIGFKEGRNIKNGKSGIYQDVSIPSAATNINLSVWYKFYTTDKCNYDFINIYLKDTSNNVLRTYLKWCCSDCEVGELNTYGWNQITDNLTDFTGQTVRIYFEVENRSDWRHRSWAYIDEVSLRYIPTFPPSVTTESATGIKTTEAILNGKLTDMGRANSVEVWFVWDVVSHDKWQDYPNETNHNLETSIGPFSAGVGNLSSATTYHFRAIAKSDAGTVFGTDLQFSTEYSAAGGWISPTGHEDPTGLWVNEPNAYDAPYTTNYIETYAENRGSQTGYRGFIVFTLSEAIRSNKIRINADYLDIHIDHVDIDVLREGNWIDVHTGPIANCAWYEISFSEGLVTKARFRYNYKVSNWWYWVYEFQFYQVPAESITLPAGNTSEASSIEENTAILHGMVTDDGRELCQTRFQYGKTDGYGMNTEWEGSWASGDTFGKLISGLEQGVTYHFRAQIKNSAGITSGADKTLFTQSALSGWVSPQGFNDPVGKWENESYAYDDEIGTYAKSYRYPGDGVWSPYLYLSRGEISCDKIRFWARELVEVDLIVIDIYRDGSWVNVYNGTFPDYQWLEVSFNGGRVSQARIQFHSRYDDHYFYYHLYEFDFWKIADPPTLDPATGGTKEATNIGTSQATLNGELSDLGGASEVNVWFVLDASYHENWQDYASSTPVETMIYPGEFNYTVTDLLSAAEYHFRAMASNAAGTVAGIDRAFTTLGECTTGATTTCSSGEGCDHTIECQEDGIWPPCPRDECVKNATSTPDCPCPEDYCIDVDGDGYENDWLDHPDYGNCTDSCTCNTSTDPGQPCEPTIHYDNREYCNRSPSAINLSFEEGDYCFSPYPPIFLSWEFSDPELPEDKQSAYRVEISTDSVFSNIVNRSCDPNLTNPNARCQTLSTIYAPTNLSYNTTYYWRVKVWDSRSAESAWSYPPNNPISPPFPTSPPGDSFDTDSYRHPWPDFSWYPQSPNVGELIQFCSVYEEVVEGEEVRIICPTDLTSCYDTSCEIWEWDFDGDGATDSTNKNPTYSYSGAGTYQVTLRVTDSLGCACTTDSKNLTVILPLPRWREVAPF